MIPRKIISIWLNDDPKIPVNVRECLDSQIPTGYELKLITLEDFVTPCIYVDEAIETRQYAKAVDYLRIYYLHKEGGVYLDCDVVMERGKNFDDLLGEKMFVGREKNNFISNAIIGAEAGLPILKDYIETVERNFLGSGDLVFAPGMYLFNEMIWKHPEGVKILPSSFFLPYDHQTGITEKTSDTRCTHLFNKSWL